MENHAWNSEGRPASIPFWSFGSTAACAGDVSQCGSNYFWDGYRTRTPTHFVNVTYVGLAPSSSFQLTPTQASATLLGSFLVDRPYVAHGERIDLLNSDEADANLGADFRFGFGTANDPIYNWTARDGEVTGRVLHLPEYIPEPSMSGLLLIGCMSLLIRRNGF